MNLSVQLALFSNMMALFIHIKLKSILKQYFLLLWEESVIVSDLESILVIIVSYHE